jgi:hypothetical protein
MLTAKNADPDVVTGLTAGADDYITKPFSMVQLQARIEAVLRRADRVHNDRDRVRPRSRPDPHLTAPAEVYSARAVTATSDLRLPAGTPRVASQSPNPGAPAQLDQPKQPNPPLRRLGQQVREARLTRGLSLHQIERACKIRWEFLQAIEQENWSYIPRAQLPLALRTYTAYLGLDLRELLGRPAPARSQPLLPVHFAAFMAVVLVLLVVGLYFF